MVGRTYRFRLANNLGNSFGGILENVRGNHWVDWYIRGQIQSGHFLILLPLCLVCDYYVKEVSIL